MILKEKFKELVKLDSPHLNDKAIDKFVDCFLKQSKTLKDIGFKNTRMKELDIIDNKNQQLSLFDSILYKDSNGTSTGFIFDFCPDENNIGILVFLRDRQKLQELTKQQCNENITKIDD